MSLMDRRFLRYLEELETDLAHTRFMAWSLVAILFAVLLSLAVVK